MALIKDKEIENVKQKAELFGAHAPSVGLARVDTCRKPTNAYFLPGAGSFFWNLTQKVQPVILFEIKLAVDKANLRHIDELEECLEKRCFRAHPWPTAMVAPGTVLWVPYGWYAYVPAIEEKEMAQYAMWPIFSQELYGLMPEEVQDVVSAHTFKYVKALKTKEPWAKLFPLVCTMFGRKEDAP